MFDDIKFFQRSELFRILQELVKVNSENPPGKEEAIAKYVQKVLIENGIEAELRYAGHERPNVIARLKGNLPGSTMIFNGHLDVVPAGDGWTEEPFGGKIRKGKLYGRGAADMKSGVAAMMYAAMVLKRLGARFPGEIILFFNVDEERFNLGMKKFLTEDIRADYAIIGEPTGLDICIGHKGCARYRLKTFGTPGHTSVVTHPDNAIYKMTKIISSLETLSQEIRQRVDPVMGHVSLTVSKIKGGRAVNIVPDFCEIEIDRRTFPDETAENVLREIDACAKKVAECSNFIYDLELYQFVAATLTDKEDPFVQRLASIAARIREKESSVTIFGATCEAPFLSIEKGIPTVIFGPGNLAQAHVTDEFVALDEVEQASLILINLALDFPASR